MGKWWECRSGGCFGTDGENHKMFTSAMRKPCCKMCGRKVQMYLMEPQPPDPDKAEKPHRFNDLMDQWIRQYRK